MDLYRTARSKSPAEYPYESRRSLSHSRARGRSPHNRREVHNSKQSPSRSLMPPPPPRRTARTHSLDDRGSVNQPSSDVCLPKHFDKPLTCFFWFHMGRCNKRDVDCAYAHWDTGYLAGAPIAVPGTAGVGSVAGRTAQNLTSDKAPPSGSDRERWAQLKARERVVELKEKSVVRREKEVRISEKRVARREEALKNACSASSGWVCEDCAQQRLS